MAIKNSLFLRGSKGKLAGTTLYKTQGVTIQREINYSPSNPRTVAQMNQRIRLANLVNMYRAGKTFFPAAFERKKALESDYNKFVGLNLTASPVALTKSQAASGIFVPADYAMTQGSLQFDPGILMAGSNITIKALHTKEGGLPSGAALSVSGLLAELQATDNDVRPGDQISLVYAYFNGTQSNFRKLEIILDATDETAVSSHLPSWVNGENGVAAVQIGSGIIGGVACCLSRRVAGKIVVSSSIMKSNISAAGAAFTSDAAIANAIASYGSSKEVFLDTGLESVPSDGGNAPAPTMYNVNVTSANETQGTVSATATTAQKGTVVTLTASPKSGYSFDKWSDGNTQNPRSIVVNADVNLTASFKTGGGFGA